MKIKDVWRESEPGVHAFLTRPWNTLGNTATVAGTVAMLTALVKWNTTLIPVSYLSLLSLYLIWRYVRQERWARYSEANRVLESGLNRLKEVSDQFLYRNCSEDELITGLGDVMSALASAFTLVTGYECRTTLKEVYLDCEESRTNHSGPKYRNVLVAASIARSDRSENNRVRSEPPELVELNSDFEEVIRDSRPFFSNDLVKAFERGEYRNSKWGDELRKTRDFPYRSAIVWPIEASRPGEVPTDGSQNRRVRVIALLCVDSRRRKAFVRATDRPMGQLFAHSLYPLLRYHLGD